MLDPREQDRCVSDVLAKLSHDGVEPEDAEWIRRLAELHPGDVSALAPLWMHRIILAPGEALFLGAGTLHTYLRGSAVEVMANSDNVLRGGLTRKHLDPDSLRATLFFEPDPPNRLRPI